MCNMSSGSGSSQCSTTCIGKKIQDFYRASRITDLVTEPVPVDSLFRKQTGMFETEWFQMEGQVSGLDKQDFSILK